MKALQALDDLKSFASESDLSLDRLSPTAAVNLMTEFYQRIRADDCVLEADGDMLLFQWGAYDWGDGLFFTYNLTRQFLFPETFEEDGETWQDDCIWQLALTLKFKPTPDLTNLAPGNRWCLTPEQLGDFVSFIHECEATKQIQSQPVESIELTFGQS